MKDRRDDTTKCAVLIGCGNIGSHLAPLLARMPEIGEVRLVDPDTYDPRNVTNQDIDARNVGRRKVDVQAERIAAVRSDLVVRARAERVQCVPLGFLRGDVILTALDSKAARQAVNEVSWRLGVPWIDTGVLADDLLVRVNVYVPGRDAACLECAWSERDYAALDQVHACGPGAVSSGPRPAAALGAAAAALQAVECRKVLAGALEEALVGQQVVLDLGHHRHYRTVIPRNPRCRGGHPEAWSFEPLATEPRALSIGEVMERAPSTPAELRIPGLHFARALRCRDCGDERPCLRLVRHAPDERQGTCRRCRGPLVAAGFDLVEGLRVRALTEAELKHSLRRVGIRTGDVLCLAAPGAATRHIELVGSADASGAERS